MALCKKARICIKQLMTDLTPELETIIDSVLNVSGGILNNKTFNTLRPVLDILPQGRLVNTAIDVAISTLTKIEAIKNEKDIDKKQQMFLDDIKQLDLKGQHSQIIKWAQLVVATLHGDQLPEATYDTLVQLKVFDTKTK